MPLVINERTGVVGHRRRITTDSMWEGFGKGEKQHSLFVLGLLSSSLSSFIICLPKANYNICQRI